ncbi:hypothetical protein M9H77_08936 [Catharanthus roseus]|uniref:Uncharacterized protein n=1 Tax=Catharanthus roseus TaxID=4058 RepID=A0ACC0BZ80_CATRO|nr:hypothetical protein M9H77_08936 [Catharanthus roseus]
MRLWKRASGVLKDQNSLWISSLSRRSTLWNPDIDSSVIKATSHHEFYIDYKNFHRVLSWLRLSDVHIKPTIRSITIRMEKTRSWIVALKGLMLMHGVVSTRVSVVQFIGRLPFDLSNFKDGHSKLGKTWAYNAFIRAYYAFLDSKSFLLYTNLKENNTFYFRRIHRDQSSIKKEIVNLQKMQGLIDLLLQIKPLSSAADVFLIVEAMDGIVMESFDIYSRMCKMIANVVSKIQTVAKSEATMILRILEKAVVQGNELTMYFELCREIGVERALEIPNPPRIPDEDIELLKKMVNNNEVPSEMPLPLLKMEEEEEGKKAAPSKVPKENQKKISAIVVRTNKVDKKEDLRNDPRSEFRTIITNNWEKFDEDFKIVTAEESPSSSSAIVVSQEQSSFFTLSEFHHGKKYQELPDLITFS